MMPSQLPNVLQVILCGISLTLSAHGESANSIFGSLRENRLSWVSRAPLPFPEPWNVNISHGELIRASNDKTMLVDLNGLEFLYQGWDRKTRIPGVLPGRFNGYHETPWKLGLLRVAGSTLVTPPNTQSGI